MQTLHTCEISHGLTWTRNAAACSWFQERTENIQNICWNHRRGTLTTRISTRCKCLRGLRDWFRVFVVLQMNTYPHKRGEENTICFILQGHSQLCDAVRNIMTRSFFVLLLLKNKNKNYKCISNIHWFECTFSMIKYLGYYKKIRVIQLLRKSSLKEHWHCLFYYYSLEKFYFNKTASLINIW